MDENKVEVIDTFWRPEDVHNTKTGRRRKYQTDIEMYTDIEEYFSINAQTVKKSLDKKGNPIETKLPATWEGLLDYCKHLTTRSVEPYKKGQYDDENNNYSGLLHWAHERIKQDWIERGATGAYNERIVLANLSANYDWVQEKKIRLESTQNLTADEATRQMFALLGEAQEMLGMDRKPMITGVEELIDE